MDLSQELLTYLSAWHSTTVERKRDAGFEVDLSFDDFLSLFEQRQLESLQRAIDEHRLQGLQDRDNPYAYVATWRSYAACSSGIYNKATACVCSRMKSAAINKPQAGDKLRDSHKANISRKLTGKPKTDAHRAAIGESSKGQKKEPWSEERKAARRNLLAAKKAGGA